MRKIGSFLISQSKKMKNFNSGGLISFLCLTKKSIEKIILNHKIELNKEGMLIKLLYYLNSIREKMK
jgi:hypothetical protein